MFLSVDGQGQATIEIKRSVFICNVSEINDYDDGLAFVKEIAKRYPDATHNCYAFVTRDGRQKFSDNGEPQGTAGMPMLDVIKKSGLCDVACVVTRYFGGIKLGTGGLCAAYTQSVVEGLKSLPTVEKTESVVRTASLGYDEYAPFLRMAESFGAVLIPPIYGLQIELSFCFPIEKDGEWEKKEKEFFGGNVRSSVREKKFMKYKKE